MCPLVGGGDRVDCTLCRYRNAAWVGVLDNRHRRLGKIVRSAQGRISVHVVVVRHLFAAEKPGLRDTRQIGRGAAQRRRLMRFFAVSQYPRQRKARLKLLLETRVAGLAGQGWAGELPRHPSRDCGVVLGGVRKRGQGQLAALV